VVLDDGGGRGTRHGGVVVVVVGRETTDGLRLNRASRFGHTQATLSDGHAPMLYYQTKREVRALYMDKIR